MAEDTYGLIVTTVAELVRSISVAPDCSVESFFDDADSKVVAKISLNDCIVEIDGHIVTTRGELRGVLMSGDINRVICVKYKNMNLLSEPVMIEGSVKFDGEVSEIAPRSSPEALLAELESEQSEPPSPHLPERKVSFFQSDSLQNVAPSIASISLSDSNALYLAAKPVSEEGGGFPFVSFSEGLLRNASSVWCQQTSPPEVSSKQNVPALLQFEKIDTFVYTQPEELQGSNSELSVDTSVRKRLMRALDAVGVGACFICICQDACPIAEIELAAMSLDISLVTFDLGVKLRFRPKPATFIESFKATVSTGGWFVLVNAHKSIASCRLLEDVLKDAESRNFEGFNPNAKIIICMEPHPHFPRHLTKRAEVARIQRLFSGPFLELPAITSVSRNNLVTTGSLCSQRAPVFGSAALPLTSSSSFAVNIVGGGSDSATATSLTKRRVRINATVDVVEIAPRDVFSKPRSRQLSIRGNIVFSASFAGVAEDKFFCIASAGVAGRFAVGSSIGNVYFVDEVGNSLVQAHIHDAPIWGLCFKDRYSFATACEAEFATEWVFETTSAEGVVLTQSSTTPFNNSVCCVAYLRGERNSPLLIGGLGEHLLISNGDDNVQCVETSSSAHVMDSFPTGPVVLVGCGDGCVTAVDIMTASIVAVFKEHTNKLTALSIRDNNQFFTGSFDTTLRFWDHRATLNAVGELVIDKLCTSDVTHTLKLREHVTGLHIDDMYLAACAGENLYLWDIRMPNVVLGGYQQAWQGISRGVQIHSFSKIVLTASRDGYVRFWEFF